MGTIRARRRKDGSTGYTAQIRVTRDGRLVHAEAGTFGKEGRWLAPNLSAPDRLDLYATILHASGHLAAGATSGGPTSSPGQRAV
jgi:hypothetical protein